MMDLLARINRDEGMTIIMVTHDHELAARADRRISLRDGRVVADETADESVRAAGEEFEEATRA